MAEPVAPNQKSKFWRGTMTEPQALQHSLDPRVAFAAERTLLAWVRTGVALMGFGFVVARFGLFLREIEHVPGASPLQRGGLSLTVGTTLVLFGVLVNAGAALKHCRTIRRLERGQPLLPQVWSLGVIVALLLGVLGVFMAGYLLFGFNSP